MVLLRLYVLTREIEVIKCRKQNMAVLLKLIAIKVCSLNAQKYKVKTYNFFRLCLYGYVPNILSSPSIICVDNRSGGFKISAWY